jgi:hypothetical protein
MRRRGIASNGEHSLDGCVAGHLEELSGLPASQVEGIRDGATESPMPDECLHAPGLRALNSGSLSRWCLHVCLPFRCAPGVTVICISRFEFDYFVEILCHSKLGASVLGFDQASLI